MELDPPDPAAQNREECLVQKAAVKHGGGAADDMGHGEVFRSIYNTTVCKLNAH